MSLAKLLGRGRKSGLPMVAIPATTADPTINPADDPVRAEQTYSPQPAPGTLAAANRYFAAYQRPRIDADRWMIVAVIEALIILLMAVAFSQLLPLKQPMPFFVTYDPNSGAVYRDTRVAKMFTPTDANKAYFLRLWATNLLTIKPNPAETLTIDVPKAASWTAGAASRQLEEYVTKTDPIAKRVADIKGLTREILVNSITYSQDGKQAYLLVTLTELINGKVSETSTKLLTINFVLAYENLKPEDADENPLGIKIDYFTLTSYYGPNSAAAAGAK